jgi:hypothetical protein
LKVGRIGLISGISGKIGVPMGQSVRRNRGRSKRGKRRRKGREKRHGRLAWMRGVVVRAKGVSVETYKDISRLSVTVCHIVTFHNYNTVMPERTLESVW